MTKKAEGKTGKLGFREQVGLFLGTGEVPWGEMRERVLAAGGDSFDVAVILGWRLHEEGMQEAARRSSWWGSVTREAWRSVTGTTKGRLDHVL